LVGAVLAIISLQRRVEEQPSWRPQCLSRAVYGPGAYSASLS
jgi:hypothetical protein